MSKRRIGLAAAIGLGVTALIGAPQVTAQDEPLPEGATAAQIDGGTGAYTATYTGDGSNPDGTRTASGDSDLEFVALGAGCRVFDTRSAFGPLPSGVQRTYSLKPGNAAVQGGSAGCGVPPSASAVDMSLSTLANSPTGTGFVRAGKGSAAPTATVLQFLRNQGTSVTTTVSLNSSEQIRLLASGANTGMTGDLLGYWERPLHASVASNGTLERGSGVVEVEESDTVDGIWVVTFERDVSKCTPVAIGRPTDRTDIGATLNGPSGEIYVRTQTSAGGNASRAFRLTVNC